MKSDRTKQNTPLWFVWLAWISGLACYAFGWKQEFPFIAAGLLLAFVIYLIINKKGFVMFRKKTLITADNIEASPQSPAVDFPAGENESSVGRQTSRRCTVIAHNTLFTGNIEIEGDIHIYGKVQGNITLKDGILYVMREGFIEGEFTSPSIVINGHVSGTCVGESVEIHEHGEMEGIVRGVAFSIRPGGCFVGKSERLAVKKETKSQRVVEMKKNPSEKTEEKTAEEAAVLSVV